VYVRTDAIAIEIVTTLLIGDGPLDLEKARREFNHAWQWIRPLKQLAGHLEIDEPTSQAVAAGVKSD
jgi:hypothetical protein